MGKNTAAADSKTGKQIQQKMNQLINLKRCYVISSGQGGAMAHVCLHVAPPVVTTFQLGKYFLLHFAILHCVNEGILDLNSNV